MPMFRKKPVMIEAVQFDGRNASEIRTFMGGTGGEFGLPADETGLPAYVIPTLEGKMVAAAGDWIIRGVKGEFYPCKPAVFEASYEPA